MQQWRQLYEYEKPQCMQVISISHFRCQTYAKTPEILAAKVGTICREVCPVILLKSSLTQHLGIWFWISKHVFVLITFFVSECSTYSLSLPSMSMDHDSNQVMKFLFMRSDWSVSVLNKGLKLELHLLRLICVYVLICILYVLNIGSVKWALR